MKASVITSILLASAAAASPIVDFQNVENVGPYVLRLLIDGEHTGYLEPYELAQGIFITTTHDYPSTTTYFWTKVWQQGELGISEFINNHETYKGYDYRGLLAWKPEDQVPREKSNSDQGSFRGIWGRNRILMRTVDNYPRDLFLSCSRDSLVNYFRGAGFWGGPQEGARMHDLISQLPKDFRGRFVLSIEVGYLGRGKPLGNVQVALNAGCQLSQLKFDSITSVVDGSGPRHGQEPVNE